MTAEGKLRRPASPLALPERDDLVREFNFISRCRYQAVAGVWRVDSGVSGPTVGITIHTHGNEPCGLAVLWHLRQQLDLRRQIRRGAVMVVLNNLRATTRYLRASTDAERAAARYTEVNFNRLPADLLQRENDRRYEIGRARSLYPIWKQFDVAMDVHSTGRPSKPMIVPVGPLDARLIRGFPIDTMIEAFPDVQSGRPASAFYGGARRRIAAFGIEAGSHERRDAFKTAIACTDALLRNARVIVEPSPHQPAPARRYTVYRAAASISFPDPTFRLVKQFRFYETVRKGQLLAVGSAGRKITARITGCVLFPPVKRRRSRTDEEVLFLSRQPRTVWIR